MNSNIIKSAAEQGLPALKDLFEKLPEEDALKGLGITAIVGITGTAFKAILEIVRNK